MIWKISEKARLSQKRIVSGILPGSAEMNCGIGIKI